MHELVNLISSAHTSAKQHPQQEVYSRPSFPGSLVEEEEDRGMFNEEVGGLVCRSNLHLDSRH